MPLTSELYYNIANGYLALAQIRLRESVSNIYFKETELNQARDYYKKALCGDLSDCECVPEIWTNLGNCLDYMGRVVDAIDCYENALKMKPSHGMALGNKGIALYFYSHICGDKRPIFLAEAHSCLNDALRMNITPESINQFKCLMGKIESCFPDKQDLFHLKEHTDLKINDSNNLEYFLTRFCVNNKLYLNLCNYCQKCNESIGDPIVINKMIVPVKPYTSSKEDPFLRLSSYLNQIKYEYITSRFLIFLSRREGIDFNFVDDNVRLIDTLNYEINNVSIQLLELSFKSFYNVLDKIAFFINDYLKLGLQDNQINFTKIWYSNKKCNGINEKLVETKNSSLNALYDLHKELESGNLKNIRLIRNALTHRFIDVKILLIEENSEAMDEERLFNQTLELAKLVRNAIIYLLSFVDQEENKRERDIKKKLVTLPAFEITNLNSVSSA